MILNLELKIHFWRHTEPETTIVMNVRREKFKHCGTILCGYLSQSWNYSWWLDLKVRPKRWIEVNQAKKKKCWRRSRTFHVEGKESVKVMWQEKSEQPFWTLKKSRVAETWKRRNMAGHMAGDSGTKLVDHMRNFQCYLQSSKKPWESLNGGVMRLNLTFKIFPLGYM